MPAAPTAKPRFLVSVTALCYFAWYYSRSCASRLCERAMADVLQDYRTVWDRKPVLRLVYEDFYDRIVAACASGMTIEIGGGIGNLKQRLNNVVATDIQFGSWLDCVADAQYLPFATGIAANIVMVDVLHHIEFPTVFFREAERVLRRGG